MMFDKEFGWKNLFLHAGKLEFTHPFTIEKLILKATFPEDWVAMFKAFSWKNPL
jgi:tRNA pseudouridine65 synthase